MCPRPSKKCLEKFYFLLFTFYFLLFTFIYAPDLTVTFINVGQVGDSILIQTPLNKNILIDGGLWYAGEKNIAPVLKNKNIEKIDTIILTHPHGDHYGGLEYILKNFKVLEVLDSGIVSPVEPYQDFLLDVKKNGAAYKIVAVGEKYDWGGCEATVLNAKNEVLYGTEAYNNHSIVIRVVHGKNSFLFTGDIEKEAENFLQRNDIKSTVLKIPHHGSSSSSSYEFLKKVSPKIAVLTVGEPNDYGLPVFSTLEKYKQLNVKLYRTDIDGNIEIISDGKNLKINTEKKSDINRYSASVGTFSINYDDFWMYMDKGWFLVRDKKFDEAVVELKKAVMMDPNSADARSKLGYAYKKTNNSVLAEKEFLKAISLNDKEYYARIHLGLMYYFDDNFDEAITLFRKALEVEPHGRYTDLLNEKIKEIEEK
ncbi:MAG: MBL fold metallo-hydrolase [Elusimicrobia bacterium]|nr:MBL fold metallo-hydrolase [Elusimicrobiota bacterium]